MPATYDKFVPSHFPEFLARANFHSSYIDLAELRKFDDVANRFQPSSQLSEKLNSQTLLNHCLRCYYFSIAILDAGFPSNTPSVPQISREELIKQLYLTCILHDLGLSTHEDAASHPAHDMTFEFHGGLMVYEHLRAEYAPSLVLDDSQIADITQSIMLHDVFFDAGMSSATGMLMQLSAFFDMLGYGVYGTDSMECMLHRDTVRELEKAFPRGDMVEGSTYAAQEMMRVKPNCHLTRAPTFAARLIKGVHCLADSH
ncbi:hypothetical protein BDP27DRAFT_1425908 [Rhodocollybia butyracea]|uniref:HD domain-containing protein n=1 Tax=Rhodocollybia butyracea TaxID=206335 RepID=A0A9P5U434_9AGAR|nr:hypothetical protein BDP27DRAFT_1425908 [Rhodocollybia butyracea]